MRRLLTVLTSALALAGGTLAAAAPASAADSLGWDAGMKCFYQDLHFSIVKVQWAYHVSNGSYVYKPYAVRVLEADGAHHRTVDNGVFYNTIDGANFDGEVDIWVGPVTYTFGPTRLTHSTSYGTRGQVALTTNLLSPNGTTCWVDNSPS